MDRMTDKRGTKIVARTFFNEMLASGFTPNQIIEVSGELLELMTSELKDRGEQKTVDQRKVA